MKAVLFDLDGTLLDTTEGVLESAIFAAQKLGLQALPHDVMLRFVGPPIQNSFINYYGCSSDQAQYAAEIFRNYYKEHALLKAKLYPGIINTLAEIQKERIKIGVATYKREDYAISILEHFGIAPYCQSMHGADNFNQLTKADIVNLCLDELGESKSDVVLVGDTEHDAVGAQKANVAFLGVTYGFGFKSKEDIDAFPNIGYADNTIEIIKYLR